MAYKDYEELNKRQQPGLRSRMGNSQAASANQAQALRNPPYNTSQGGSIQNVARTGYNPGGGGNFNVRSPLQAKTANVNPPGGQINAQTQFQRNLGNFQGQGGNMNIPNDASGRVYNRVRPGVMNINRAPGFGVGLALAGATDQMYNNPMVQGQLQTAEQGLQRQFPNYQSPFPRGQGINQYMGEAIDKGLGALGGGARNIAEFAGNAFMGGLPLASVLEKGKTVEAINDAKGGGRRTEPLAIPPRKQGRTMPLESGNPTLLEQNYGKVNPEQAAELRGQQQGLPISQNVQGQYNQFGYRNDDPMSLLSKEQLANMAMRKELMNEQDVIQSIRDAHNFDNYGVVPGGAPLPMPRQGLQNFYGQQEVDLQRQQLGIDQQRADAQEAGMYAPQQPVMQTVQDNDGMEHVLSFDPSTGQRTNAARVKQITDALAMARNNQDEAAYKKLLRIFSGESPYDYKQYLSMSAE